MKFFEKIFCRIAGFLALCATAHCGSPLDGWSVSPFSQFEPTSKENAVRLRRDNNSQANPPGIIRKFRIENPQASFTVSFSYSACVNAVPVCRVRTTERMGEILFWNGKDWEKTRYAPFNHFFQSDRSNKLTGMGNAVNLSKHTLALPKGVESKQVSFTVKPLAGKQEYLLEFYNAGVNSEMLLHEFSIREEPTEGDPAEWAAMRIVPGIPTPSPNRRGEKRDVIVHVVPWHSPHGRKIAKDPFDPNLNYSSLDTNNDDEQKRVDTHLLAMRNAGIDVIALDAMVRTDWKPGQNPKNVLWHGTQCRLWLDAIRRLAPEMRFCLQLDRAGGQPPSTEVWPAAIEAIYSEFASHPNYYHINGRPVLLTFWINQSTPDDELRQIRTKVKNDFLIIANVLENPNKLLSRQTRSAINLKRMKNAIQTFDGLDICPLGAHISWLTRSYEKIAPLVKAARKPLFWGVASGYYRRGTAFIEPSWEYLHTLWCIAINQGANNVILWTWNDIDEDHDIMPSSLKGDSLLELNALYIQYYKRGVLPELNDDRIFLSYPARDGDRREPGGGESPTWPNLNYFAWMTAPGTLHVPGIGKVDLEKGLNVGQLGKTTAGYPSNFSLEREGRTTMQGIIPHPMKKSENKDREFMQYRWVSLHHLNTIKKEIEK